MRKPILAVAILALALWAVPRSLAQKNFSDVTSVVLVEIPVTVSVGGEPVRGLKAEDFEVIDGRKTQDIVGFDVIDLSNAAAAEAAGVKTALPAAGRRHFLFLFDLSFSEPSAIVRAREAAHELVFNGLHGEDLAAVAIYTTQGGPKILTGFTQDRAQLDLALDTLGNPKLVKRSGDPLGLVYAQVDGGSPIAGGKNPSEARVATEEAVRTYVQDFNNLVQRDNRQDMQNKVTGMTRQLADLAKLLNSVDGRKYVVLLSEGFDDTLLVGSAGQANRGSSDVVGSADASTGGSVMTSSAGSSATDEVAFGGGVTSSTDEMFGRGKVQNDLQRMLQQFREANCTIQAVDIAGLKAGGSVRSSASGQNALAAMASETGGEVFRNFNNLSQAMGQMLAKTSVTYLLAIQPDDLKRDGKFHRLKVRLKNGPKGADVFFRPGFFAPVPVAQQNALERQLATSSEIFGETGGQLGAAVLAVPLRVPSERAYTPVMIEVDGKSLTAGMKGTTVPLEVYVYALDGQGEVHDFFAQTVGIDLKKVGETVKQSGVKYFGHLDLNPGRYDVRVLVRNLETGVSNLQIVPVVVPDWGNNAPAITTPFVPEPPNKWLMIRETAERQRNVPYPFQLHEAPFFPAAVATLPASGEAELPFAAYNFPAGALSVKARLSGANHEEVKGLEVTKVQRVPNGTTGGDMLVLAVRANGLAPGAYTFEVQVGDPASGKKAYASLPITVPKG